VLTAVSFSDATFRFYKEDFVEQEQKKKGMTEQTLALIPKTREQLVHVMNNRKGDSIKDIARSLAKYLGTTPRSVEWIVEHGLCVENLIPGKSKIQQAGQGAIAQYPLKKGEMVVPAPLLQIVDRDVLATYDMDNQKVGPQLLLNYCFGHAESSLLLCPDTNAILINHCSLRENKCGSKGPNARVQWASSGWEKDNDKWLQMSLSELGQQRGRGIAMEVVAMRDIQPGEEVCVYRVLACFFKKENNELYLLFWVVA
jgi:hypothetical protein